LAVGDKIDLGAARRPASAAPFYPDKIVAQPVVAGDRPGIAVGIEAEDGAFHVTVPPSPPSSLRPPSCGWLPAARRPVSPWGRGSGYASRVVRGVAVRGGRCARCSARRC